MDRMTINVLIVIVVVLAVITGSWEVHLISSVNGEPYASTQEFLNFIAIATNGILGLILWQINRREK